MPDIKGRAGAFYTSRVNAAKQKQHRSAGRSNAFGQHGQGDARSADPIMRGGRAQGFWERRPGDWGIGTTTGTFTTAVAGGRTAADWTKINPIQASRNSNYATFLNTGVEKLGGLAQRGVSAGVNRMAIKPGEPVMVPYPGQPEQLALNPAPSVRGEIGPMKTWTGTEPGDTSVTTSDDWAASRASVLNSRYPYAIPTMATDVDPDNSADSGTLADNTMIPTRRSGSRTSTRKPKGNAGDSPSVKVAKTAAGTPLQSVGNPWETAPARLPGTPLQGVGNPWAYDPRE